MKDRMSRLLLLSFLLLSLLGGCSGESASPSGQQTNILTDDLGRPVHVTPPVNRILTLAPSLTELVFAVGGGDRLVGVSTADDYPPEVEQLPRFQALPLNIEAILALEPELVLATDQINRLEDAERLEEMGIPVYFFHFDELADIPRAMRTLGYLLGTETVADSAARAFETRVAHIRSRVARATHRPGVLILIGVETLYSFGSPSYVHELIEMAGGQSLTRDFQRPNIVLNDEFVLKVNPEIIVILSDQPEDRERLLEHHPTFTLLRAVREQRVYTINPDVIVRPGPRLVEGLEQLARLLHPEVP